MVGPLATNAFSVALQSAVPYHKVGIPKLVQIFAFEAANPERCAVARRQCCQDWFQTSRSGGGTARITRCC